MKRCPKCGCEEFYVTAHVVQDWLVDYDGNYIKTADDIWTCKKCRYEADGNEFNVKEE